MFPSLSYLLSLFYFSFFKDTLVPFSQLFGSIFDKICNEIRAHYSLYSAADIYMTIWTKYICKYIYIFPRHFPSPWEGKLQLKSNLEKKPEVPARQVHQTPSSTIRENKKIHLKPILWKGKETWIQVCLKQNLQYEEGLLFLLVWLQVFGG